MSKNISEELFSLDQSLLGDRITECNYPWETLPRIGEYIIELGEKLPADKYDQIKDYVWVAKNAKISDSADITGPCIIGENTEVRHCAFIRGKALIGNNCVVGNSTELKNVILFNNVQVPHYNYVGDSILGYGSHMGAGSITSNVRSDKKLITVKLPEGNVETSSIHSHSRVKQV